MYISDDSEELERSSSWHHLGHKAKKPSRITMCYFLGAAYVTSIGSTGSLLGSGANFALKYFYEEKFKGQTIEFLAWMAFNVPLMLINTLATWIYLQWYFLGMFTQEDSQQHMGERCEIIVKQVITRRYNQLGPISPREIQVAMLFVIRIILNIVNLIFAPKWITSLPNDEHFTNEATFSMLIVVGLFVLPANWKWLRFLNGKSSEFPKARTHSLITWKFVQRKLPWSIFFLLGCGFALARGGDKS